jgi:hypothetical protein
VPVQDATFSIGQPLGRILPFIATIALHLGPSTQLTIEYAGGVVHGSPTGEGTTRRFFTIVMGYGRTGVHASFPGVVVLGLKSVARRYGGKSWRLGR